MGVYHLMGLGKSPGAVTGAISYLAMRYQRWNDCDQEFFADSGEEEQRENEEKVGDIQALILFTTKEIIEANGEEYFSEKYIINRPGNIDRKQEEPDAIKQVLESLLKKEWSKITNREEVKIYWCAVDRRDIIQTYTRIAQIVASLAVGAGSQGKEMWMNLTGGNNVINFALQQAATLSGHVARLYYLQAENSRAEKCIRYTNEDNYWVDLPVMPLDITGLSLAILDILEQMENTTSKDLYSLLSDPNDYHYYSLVQNISKGEFKDFYLKPLWKQRIILKNEDNLSIGSQGKKIQGYRKIMQDALKQAGSENEKINLERLVDQSDWIEVQSIKLL